VLHEVLEEETMNRRRSAGGVVALGATAVLALTMNEWSATIRPVDGSTIAGTATVLPGNGDTLSVNIRIKGGRSGETLPWHLHSGGCESSGAVLGDARQYVPMVIAEDLTGTETAHVRLKLSVGVPYSINVHRSATNMSVVACGNLRPVAGDTRGGRG
jgi:hypothetical protein